MKEKLPLDYTFPRPNLKIEESTPAELGILQERWSLSQLSLVFQVCDMQSKHFSVFGLEFYAICEAQYRIRRNIGGALIWRCAESSCLADFNIGGEARGHVTSTLVYTRMNSFCGFNHCQVLTAIAPIHQIQLSSKLYVLDRLREEYCPG